jgi:hypoxanthine phosphoribosyltransferase
MVKLGDLYFRPFISAEQIQNRVKDLGEQISNDYGNESFIVLVVLKGGIVFGVDLLRAIINQTVELEFWQLESYHGTIQSGEVIERMPLSEKLRGKNILIVEDIVDTGDTVALLSQKLQMLQAKSIKIATALYKPQAFKHDYKLDYVGFEIENDFVVGYGLDYNGLGRGLPDIYKLKS